MQPTTANSEPKNCWQATFPSWLLKSRCIVVRQARPRQRFWEHPLTLPVRWYPGLHQAGGGVEEALNSACPKGFEHTYLPLCLLPAALWLQLHRCVCCTPLSGCEWSQRPLCRGEGNFSLHLLSLMASVVETGPSRPKLGTGNASPGLSADRWEPSPCAGQGDATAVGAKGEGEGRRLPEAPAVGK